MNKLDDETDMGYGSPRGPFSSVILHILQGSQEPYVPFLARLQEAVHRQIPCSQVTEILVLRSALRDVNKDYKQACRTVKATENLGNYLKACQDVGINSYKSSLLG